MKENLGDNKSINPTINPNNSTSTKPPINDIEEKAKIISNSRAFNSPNSINTFFIVIIALLIGLSGFLGWQNYRLLMAPDPKPTITVQPSPDSSPLSSPASELSQWKTYYIDEINLTYKVPPELTVNLEEPNPGDITLYIENGKMLFECEDLEPDCYYQLYIISQKDLSYNVTNLEDLKEQLDPESIKENNLAGYPSLSGQVKGERNRFVTYILYGERLITAFTSQPTQYNKQLTDSILSTFEFSK